MVTKSYTAGLSAFQWFIFLLASSVAFPIVLGGVFQLPAEAISSLMQRTFLVVGISSFIQGWLGHRYPIADGPAGSWVSVFVILADVTVRQGGNPQDTLPILEGGLIMAGLLLFLLGISGFVQRLLFLFTPLVTGSFLFILALQLSGVFMKGMMGLQGGASRSDWTVTGISFGLFAFVLFLSVKGRGWVKNYAVLIGIATGWAVFLAAGKSSLSVPHAADPFKLPELFAWGAPQFNAGITVTAILFTFILVSNTVAALSAIRQVVPETDRREERSLKRGSISGGISHLLSSAFSTVGIVPLPVTAGFIRLTGQTGRRPFLAACLILAGISFLPSIVGVLALLPEPVACAVILASFVQMVGISMQSIVKEALDQRRLSILGITLLISFGLMFLPAEAFQGLPSILQYVLGNGLLVGTLTVIALEQLWRPSRPATAIEVPHAGRS
ncbi:purine/pyrimidine permease [Paenibacillus sp. MBLB4367]|uniref:purine/pyrimidine permease n=1 Tax=Paenibacillus sp. MBLB4367 TaxID=3384767 RepID=UPI003908212D